MTRSFGRFGACCLIVAAGFAEAAHAQDARAAAVKSFSYGIDFGTSNSALIQYYLGAARHCVTTAGSDPAVLPEIEALARGLAAPDPEQAAALRKFGESGMLGDPAGAVPELPIRAIAAARGVEIAAFCAEFVSVLRGEVKSYREFCSIKPDSSRVVCPDTRTLYRVAP